MWNLVKDDKFIKKSLIVSIILILLFVSLIVAAVMPVVQFFREDSMSLEEWSIMMLTGYSEDVEAAIVDLYARQEQGITEAWVHKTEGEHLEISLSTSETYEIESLIGNKLYERLIKKCTSVMLHENDVISFSRRGFLRGYTGFYYSPTGEEKDVSGGAEWYKTGHLQGNYFWYEFGYD